MGGIIVLSLVLAATVTVRVQVTFVQPGVELGTSAVPENSNCYIEGRDVICV